MDATPAVYPNDDTAAAQGSRAKSNSCTERTVLAADGAGWRLQRCPEGPASAGRASDTTSAWTHRRFSAGPSDPVGGGLGSGCSSFEGQRNMCNGGSGSSSSSKRTSRNASICFQGSTWNSSSCSCTGCTATAASTSPPTAATAITTRNRAASFLHRLLPHGKHQHHQPTRGSHKPRPAPAELPGHGAARLSASPDSLSTSAAAICTVARRAALSPHKRLPFRFHPALTLFAIVTALLAATPVSVVVAFRTPDEKAEPLGNATLRALYPDHPWDLPVVASNTPLGPTRAEAPHVPFYSVQTDNDQLQLYDENLEVDLAPWRRRNRSEVTVSALLAWAAGLPRMASQRMVMIKGGRLALLQQKNGSMLSCERPCDVVLDELLKDLRSWLAESPSEWPDVVFFLNTADTSLCQRHDDAAAASVGASGVQMNSSNSGGGSGGGGRRRSKSSIGRCPAPVLSLIKEWDRHKDEDILVPVTMGMRGWAPLHYFPWSRKIERAVFRGREYCHTRGYAYAKGVCSRTYMALMSQYHSDWADLVDVGLVDNYTLLLPNRTAVHITGRGFVRAAELARFRYLLALDGITASYRLARLLSLNSVVLKQASPWIEWYYRSLVPGTHYVSIWNYHRADVLHVIRGLRHKGRYLYDIATHAQAFAYRYLTPNARRLYWLRALRAYRGLFSDMDQFLTSQEIPETEPVGA